MSSFLDQKEPVITLKGFVLPEPPSSVPEPTVNVLVSENTVVSAPRELAPFLDYVTTPRLRSETLAWVRQAGGDESDLDELIASGRLLQVSPVGGNGGLVDAFAGLQVTPMGFPLPDPEGGSNGEVVLISSEENSFENFRPAPWLLAAAMWEKKRGEDFPATVRRIAPRHQDIDSVVPGHILPRNLVGSRLDRLALSDLDGLLAARLARVETAPQRGLFARMRGKNR